MFAAAAKTAPSFDVVHPLIHGLLLLWPLALTVVVVAGVRSTRERHKAQRLRRAGIFDIDRMDGKTFERRLSVLFQSLGYRAEVVGSSRGDFGGDLVIAKDGERSVVQAKCWSKNVGVKAVQEVVAARGYYGVDSALVVTNRRFTQQALELAKRNNVKLWGRDELTRALLRAQKGTPMVTSLVEGPARSASVVSAESFLSPVSQAAFCARCGDPVSAKVRAYCLAHSARFAGLIYCYEHQRSFGKRA